MQRPALERTVSVLRAAILVALVPPAAIAWVGGADLDLPFGARVSWFDAAPAVLALVTTLASAALAPSGSRPRVALLLVGLIANAGAALLLWWGAIYTAWFHATDALRPALGGAALLGLAALPWRGRLGLDPRAVLRSLPALALGLVLLGAAVGADRALLSRALPGPGPAAPGRDAIVILVDTLRADALGAYGADPSPTPWLDDLARRSAVFERAFAQAPWTFPAVTSLMTSLYPSSLALPVSIDATEGDIPALDASAPRLAAHLHERGWHAAALYKNPMLARGAGLEQGFDVFEAVGGQEAEGRSAGQLVDATLVWARALAERRRDGAAAPFLLYLHFMDPHTDYDPPDEFWPPEARAYEGPVDGSAKSLHRLVRGGKPLAARDVAQLRRLYRADVAYLDTELRRLGEELGKLGVWTEDTCVVLTADHGEQFAEHGEYEHGDVHVENVHIPLFVHGCGVAPQRISAVVRQIDITPTLLELVGAPELPGAEGRSLGPLLRGEALPPLPAITEHGVRARVTGDRLSLVVEGDRTELFDLAADPGEERDLARSRPGEAAALAALLDAHRARPRAASAAASARPRVREVDPAVRESLRSLGYLDE